MAAPLKSLALVFSLLMLGLTGCSQRAAGPEQRRPSPRYEPIAPGSTRIQRPSHYTVKRGDTLYAIAWRYGLDYRDLARWNRVSAPFVIHPDQPLRLYPARAAVATTSPLATSEPAVGAVRVIPQAKTAPVSAQPAPVQAGSGDQKISTARLPVKPSVGPTPASPAPVPKAKPVAPAAGSAGLAWAWPVNGKVLAEFSNSSTNRQGLDIGAAVGAAVNAAAAGEVVYSGSGLAGYGELVIIKHSDRYLSAYAHNRKRFVSEGQRVTGGQKIAEVGKNGSQKPRLHFQIRQNGKPVDPRKYLPKQ